jgi:hypothetical protein
MGLFFTGGSADHVGFLVANVAEIYAELKEKRAGFFGLASMLGPRPRRGGGMIGLRRLTFRANLGVGRERHSALTANLQQLRTRPFGVLLHRSSSCPQSTIGRP